METRSTTISSSSRQVIVAPGRSATFSSAVTHGTEGRCAFLACHSNFDALATRWRRETGGLSVVSARYEHPAMQQILAMGREVVPEILRRIEREPDHWHPALAMLTGESPFAPGEKVTVSQACARWVAWGRAHGLCG